VAMYVSTSASVSRPAAWLFVPYLCWPLYATYLNAGVVILNGTGF
ncbi:MAG: tryptophan-rich sensory protein, partial [Alistipes sp.]|nr:tryptophan-rich sensory protein [Alistipes sp.]